MNKLVYNIEMLNDQTIDEATLIEKGDSNYLYITTKEGNSIKFEALVVDDSFGNIAGHEIASVEEQYLTIEDKLILKMISEEEVQADLAIAKKKKEEKAEKARKTREYKKEKTKRLRELKELEQLEELAKKFGKKLS
jgi:hypothetical protein